MPEPPAWRFQKIIKPMYDVPTDHLILKGRVLTSCGNEVIEAGFVEIEGAKIKAVGRQSDLGTTTAKVIDVDGTILPGLINSHAHLAWDGVHDLAQQALNDSVEISAYKSAGEHADLSARRDHDRARPGHEQDQLRRQTGRGTGHLSRPTPADHGRGHRPNRWTHLLVLSRGQRRRRDAPRRTRPGARRCRPDQDHGLPRSAGDDRCRA